MIKPMVAPLTETTLHAAVKKLMHRDADLAHVVVRLGPPLLWARTPGFPTLVLLILEQQVSLASARAAFNRLESAIGAVTPANVLSLSDDELRGVGFSRQKAGYVRALATAIHSGAFDPDSLSGLNDDSVRCALTSLKGIGAWTAEVYLLMALRRPDAWPVGDLALATAAQQVKRLAQRPTPGDLTALAEGWRPWRAVAARLLWHHYLTR